MRANDRHLGGVRDTQGAERDGLRHDGPFLHSGMVMVVDAPSGSAPQRRIRRAAQLEPRSAGLTLTFSGG